jgi:hypothetical protein
MTCPTRQASVKETRRLSRRAAEARTFSAHTRLTPARWSYLMITSSGARCSRSDFARSGATSASASGVQPSRRAVQPAERTGRWFVHVKLGVVYPFFACRRCWLTQLGKRHSMAEWPLHVCRKAKRHGKVHANIRRIHAAFRQNSVIVEDEISDEVLPQPQPPQTTPRYHGRGKSVLTNLD